MSNAGPEVIRENREKAGVQRLPLRCTPHKLKSRPICWELAYDGLVAADNKSLRKLAEHIEPGLGDVSR